MTGEVQNAAKSTTVQNNNNRKTFNIQSDKIQRKRSCWELYSKYWPRARVGWHHEENKVAYFMKKIWIKKNTSFMNGAFTEPVECRRTRLHPAVVLLLVPLNKFKKKRDVQIGAGTNTRSRFTVTKKITDIIGQGHFFWWEMKAATDWQVPRAASKQTNVILQQETGSEKAEPNPNVHVQKKRRTNVAPFTFFVFRSAAAETSSRFIYIFFNSWMT